jgi:UrcA family protein
MNTAKRYVLGMALLAATALTANLASAATAEDEPRQAVVSYSDLDLSQANDAHRFYRRLKQAARQVCDNSPQSDLLLLNEYETCMSKAVADAVAQVQSVQVAAIHRADARLSKN